MVKNATSTGEEGDSEEGEVLDQLVEVLAVIKDDADVCGGGTERVKR